MSLSSNAVLILLLVLFYAAMTSSATHQVVGDQLEVTDDTKINNKNNNDNINNINSGDANTIPSVTKEELQKARRTTLSHPPAPATDDQIQNLPDYNDKTVRRQLRCSACRAVAKNLFVEARVLESKKNIKGTTYKLTDLDWADLFDGVCARIVARNGLLMKDNRPTTTYSDVSNINVARGSWINTYLEDQCAALVDKHEGKVIGSYMSMGAHTEMQTVMCGVWSKVCTEKESAAHEAIINPVAQSVQNDLDAAAFYEREKKKARAKASKTEKKEKSTAEKKTPENMVPKPTTEGEL